MSPAPAPRPADLAGVLAARAAVDPDRLAYDDGTDRVTFGQLADRAAARAGALAARGVVRGDRVAIVLPAGVRFAEAFWALQLLGAAPCALNPTAGTAAIARGVALVRPRLVVDDMTDGDRPVASAVPPASPPAPDGLAFLQPTSGTSGRARAACVSQRSVLAFLDATRAAGHVSREDVMVAWVPPWHDFGLVRFVIGAVFFGASCHIVQPAIRTIPDWLATISRVGGTFTGGPDFCYRLATRMVKPGAVDLGTLRNAGNGGEPVRMSTIEAFEARFDAPGVVLPGYGLAEATLGVSAHTPGEVVTADARGNVSNGRVLPGLEVRAGRSATEPGEILVRGASVFSGYLDAPADTAARLRDGWLHTGDSGYLDGAGLLFVLGRRRGLLKRAGVPVAPRELEEAAELVPEVRVAAAIGPVTADPAEPAITLVVEASVADDGASAIAAEVSRQVVDRVGFAPDRILVVGPHEIPRTENGKVRHDQLAADLAAS